MSRTLTIMCVVVAALAIVAAGCAQCSVCSKKPEAMTCALRIDKSGPDQVLVGQDFSYTIKATNMSKEEARGVVVTDGLPENFNLASTQPQAEVSGQQLIWRIDSLPAHASMNFVVSGTATRTVKLNTCSTVACAPPSACLSVAAVQPELTITLAGPAEALACDALQYRIQVNNVGSGPATNVWVRQDLPEGMTLSDGRSAVTSNFGRLGAGEAKELTVLTRVAHRGQFSTAAVATADGGLRAASPEVATVVRKPDLIVTESAPEARYVGRPVEYTITVRNAGDGEARNTLLEEQLMSNPIFISASDGGTYDKERIRWNLGDLKPGESRTVSAMIKSDERGDVHAKAQAIAYCSEGFATAMTEIKGVPAILLEMVDLKDPIMLNAEETYRVTVTNQGSADNTNVVIRCELPPEESYLTSKGPTLGKAVGNMIEFAPLPTLAPGQKAVYDISAKGVKTGDVRFKVTLTSGELTSPVTKTESTHIYD